MTRALIPPTSRQLHLLRFIAGYLEAHDGVAPSYDEMGAGCGLGKSTVHRLLDRLEERGRIHRLRGRSRAIALSAVPVIPRSPAGDPLYFVPIGGAA